MASVRQIAQETGLSTATVSRAMNNDPSVRPQTRKRVLDAANRLRYAPAVGRRHTNVIGLVYTTTWVKTDAGVFDAAILTGIIRGAAEHRFDVMIVNLYVDKTPDETHTQYFMRKGLRGVVLRTATHGRRICQAIADEGFPSVVVAERFDTPNVNYVYCESGRDMRRAVEHLIKLGHQRIGLGIHSVVDGDHQARFEGYQQALANHGLPFEQGLVFFGWSHLGSGVSTINHWMAMPDRPTALVFTNPMETVGALKRAQELGLKVPGDLSIIGFDDHEARHGTYPAYTSVCQDTEVMGFEAADWLAGGLVAGAGGTLRKTHTTVFEINQTTGPPSSPHAKGRRRSSRKSSGRGGAGARRGVGAGSRGSTKGAR